ncbi:type II toxin-antitoxin system RelE/ParE family toxin [Erwinia aphidicola]|uniref:type II toxin-antitoxin system RelE/ParE family toxin n=1 Tax=Erwinia aphidicola TaxID=68334 RepID=UPI0030CD6204
MRRTWRLSKLAADDFRQIDRYSRLHYGDLKADKYCEGMHDCLERLAEFPLSGREAFAIISGLRCCDYQHQRIYYRIRENDIFVLRILHHKRNALRLIV